MVAGPANQPHSSSPWNLLPEKASRVKRNKPQNFLGRIIVYRQRMQIEKIEWPKATFPSSKHQSAKSSFHHWRQWQRRHSSRLCQADSGPSEWNGVGNLGFYITLTFLSKFIATSISVAVFFFFYQKYSHISFFIPEQKAYDSLNRWTANKLNAVVVGLE